MWNFVLPNGMFLIGALSIMSFVFDFIARPKARDRAWILLVFLWVITWSLAAVSVLFEGQVVMVALGVFSLVLTVGIVWWAVPYVRAQKRQ